MKKTYGVRSLLIYYAVMVAAAGYMLFVVHGIPHRHRHNTHSHVISLLNGLMFILWASIVIYSISRYNFLKIREGVTRFTSLNPFYEPVAIAITDITRIHFVVGRKKAEFIISTSNGEIKIPVLMGVQEVRYFYAEITGAGPHIILAGPEVDKNRSKVFHKLRLASLALTILILLVHFTKVLLAHH